MFGKNGINGAAQIANPFAMNNANAKNPLFLTRSQVVGHKLFDVARPECVQIQYAIDRQFYRVIHSAKYLVPICLQRADKRGNCGGAHLGAATLGAPALPVARW